jgi:hypothetical protein
MIDEQLSRRDTIASPLSAIFPRCVALDRARTLMLTEFDQNILANMTAALDAVRKRIPADKDSFALRKRIGDEIIACAPAGEPTLTS